MDESTEAFRDQVRRFLQAEIAPRLEGWREQGFIPRETWRHMGALGALLPEIPEQYGGSGAPFASFMSES